MVRGLLRANAVSYAIKGQDASGLAFGDIKMTRPPEIDKDVERMIDKGVPVYLVQEDAEDRGLSNGNLIAGIKKISRSGLPALFNQHDQIWHW